MREWLLGLAPVALIVYFVCYPAHLNVLVWQARYWLN